MKFVIDRSKWRCGGDGENRVGKDTTLLLNSHGYMCCLGQIACQLKVPKKKLLDIGSPDQLEVVLPVLTKRDNNYEIVNSSFSNIAIEINDDENLTSEERERKLASLASKYKHKIVFKGKYVR